MPEEWFRPRAIEITEYAAMRMRQRDVLEEEVEEAMNCPCNHRKREDGRWEARHPARKGNLFVVYRRGTNKRYVINAMWQ